LGAFFYLNLIVSEDYSPISVSAELQEITFSILKNLRIMFRGIYACFLSMFLNTEILMLYVLLQSTSDVRESICGSYTYKVQFFFKNEKTVETFALNIYMGVI